MPDPPYDIDFFQDENGNFPCLGWIRDDLSEIKRQGLGRAMNKVLQQQGKDVCKGDWGRDLGGIFEFKLDDEQDGENILLRVFCHLYGDKKILLLHGYDKGKNPQARYQNRQIEIAQTRLGLWKAEQRKAKRAAAKKAGSNGETQSSPGRRLRKGKRR